jgi:vacuolar-type H+-ATPase subunit I/STV1
MSLTYALLLLLVAVVVIVALGGYAYRLRKEVKRRDAFRVAEDQQAQLKSLENLDWVTAALVQEQVDITEGAWRCKVLLEIIDPSLTERSDFQAFAEHYERTKHLKTHSARQQLTPRERMEEDRERLAAEEQMRDAVLAAAEAVMTWRKKGGKGLH